MFRLKLSESSAYILVNKLIRVSVSLLGNVSSIVPTKIQ
jgi:hypothetical protein